MTNYRSLVGGFYSSSPMDKSSGPVSIRMNNPGAVNGANWERSYPGYVGEVETTPGNKSTIFETPEQGVAVWFELLKKYNAAGASTVGQIIKRYGGGQDYSQYIKQVVSWSGLTENTVIILEGGDTNLLKLAKAMFHYEAGKVSPLSDEQILYGFKFARDHAKGNVPAEPDHPPVEPAGGVPPWVTAGLKDLGFHETGENRGIERFIKDAHAGSLGDPWCAISACAWLERSGIRSPRSASSQSFRNDPNFVKLAGPAIGAIAVYWRGSPGSGLGHVGFYMGETDTQVLTLGGNESDAVRKQFEPKSRLFGYWWPKTVPSPKIAVVKVKDVDGHPVGSVT